MVKHKTCKKTSFLDYHINPLLIESINEACLDYCDSSNPPEVILYFIKKN